MGRERRKAPSDYTTNQHDQPPAHHGTRTRKAPPPHTTPSHPAPVLVIEATRSREISVEDSVRTRVVGGTSTCAGASRGSRCLARHTMTRTQQPSHQDREPPPPDRQRPPHVAGLPSLVDLGAALLPQQERATQILHRDQPSRNHLRHHTLHLLYATAPLPTPPTFALPSPLRLHAHRTRREGCGIQPAAVRRRVVFQKHPQRGADPRAICPAARETSDSVTRHVTHGSRLLARTHHNQDTLPARHQLTPPPPTRVPVGCLQNAGAGRIGGYRACAGIWRQSHAKWPIETSSLRPPLPPSGPAPRRSKVAAPRGRSMLQDPEESSHSTVLCIALASYIATGDEPDGTLASHTGVMRHFVRLLTDRMPLSFNCLQCRGGEGNACAARSGLCTRNH